MNPIIEERLKYLKAGYEQHENRLNKHDTRLIEHEGKLVKQDGIMEKLNKILESLTITHCEHLEWTGATHGIAATSYFRWHGDDATGDHL